MASITLKSVRKSFQSVEVIHGIDLTLRDGAFTVLVGPSGCGKSTLLRMMAGLEDITSGELRIDGESCGHLLPSARGMAMVFQNYALYPHMTVEQNLRFGLENIKTPKEVVAERVRTAADLLQISHLMKRRPSQLSGGQSQRVAIGRAIVKEPKAFLFDEPLSNLDAELRVKMRGELVNLHHRLKATMIYVTHDQVEAMTMAETIVVLRDGRVEQVGAPVELYARPVNQFVAGFLGAPQMNMLKGCVARSEGHTAVRLVDGTLIELPGREFAQENGAPVTLGIRPEHVEIGQGPLEVKIDTSEILGSETISHCQLASGQPFTVSQRGISGARTGTALKVTLPVPFVHIFDAAGITIGASPDWRRDYVQRT